MVQVPQLALLLGVMPAGGEVKDLLKASQSELALLQHSHLKLGCFYMCKDHEDKVFEFKSIAEDHMVFCHVPIFGEPETILVSFNELKGWKFTKRNPPKMCPLQVSKAKVAQNSDIFKAELKRIELQHILLEGFKDHITDVHGSLIFASMPGPALFCSQKLKKGGLVLYPTGTVQSLKGKDESKVKHLVLEYQHEKICLATFQEHCRV